MSLLALTLLGSFQALRDGTAITQFRGEKVRALLAYLAVESARPHTRAGLCGLLWPEHGDAAALQNLSQSLGRLRTAIGDGAGSSVLLATRHTIQWNEQSGAAVDVTSLLRLARSGVPAALEQAASLYHGPFLPGFSLPGCPEFDEWLLLTREQCERTALAALETLAELHTAAGNYPAAESAARRMLVLDPWRETAHRQLMTALAGAGRRAAALTQYDAWAQLLADELAFTPDAATTALYAVIKDGTWQPLVSAAPTMPAGGPGSAAAPATPSYGSALPLALSTMLGRERELAHISELLQPAGERMVTVVGAGGVGKTRLALAAAHRLHDSGVGVCWIPLAGIGGHPASDGRSDAETTAQLATAIAEALDVSLAGYSAVTTQVVNAVRAQSLVLVLDNLEHLLAATPWLLELLQRAPNLRLLITSRERLNVDAEVLLPLDGLHLPLDDDDPRAADFSGVQLFVQRATRIAPTLSGYANDLSAVVRLCRLLEGVPLAIELAAHWVAHYRIGDIADAVVENIGFLTTNRREYPERQRSLRAVFGYSWQLLSAMEQQVLARMSVFRGSFSRHAAQVVAQTSVAVLAALVDKSLLRQAGIGHYAVHELLRQFAAEHLAAAADDRLATRTRHAAYYLDFVAAREARLARDEPREAAAELRGEFDNIRHAWTWAVEQHQLGALDTCACSWWQFCFLTGLWSEGERAFGLAVERLAVCGAGAGAVEPARDEDRRVLSKLLAYYAAILNVPSRYGEALASAQHAVAMAQASGSAEGEAIGLYAWAKALVRAGQLQQARDRMQRALERTQAYLGRYPSLESLGIVEWQALVWLQAINARLGDYAAAMRFGTQALDRCRARHRRFGEVSCLGNRAAVARETHDLVAARRDFELALRLSPTVSFRWGEAINRLELGDVVRQQGEYGLALELTERALRILQEIGDGVEEARAAAYLGQLYCYLGDHDRADTWFAQFLRGTEAIDAPEVVGDGLMSLALFMGETGDAERALSYAEQAWRLAQGVASPYTQARAQLVLAHAQAALGLPGAAATYEQVLARYETLANADLVAEPRSGLAAVALAQGDLHAALAQVEVVLDLLAVRPFVGVDEPFAIYLTCYRVLQANHDPRATALLDTAYQRLQEYAGQIGDEPLRRSFLERVPVHRELVRAAMARAHDALQVRG